MEILVLLAALWVVSRAPSSSPAPASPSSPASAAAQVLTRLVYVHDAATPASPVKAAPTSSAPASATAKGAAEATSLLKAGNPLGPGTIGEGAGFLAVKTTSGALETAGANASFYDKTTGGALSAAGGAIGELAGVGAIAGAAGANLTGFRSATKAQRKVLLGQSALAGVQAAENAVPVVGQIASFLTGLGAQTYEGKRVVAQAGRSLEQGYEFQKNLVNGDVSEAFSGGGSSHKQRVSKLLQAQAVAKQSQLAVLSIKPPPPPSGSVGGRSKDVIAAQDAARVAESARVSAAQAAKLPVHTGGNPALTAEQQAAVQAKNQAFSDDAAQSAADRAAFVAKQRPSFFASSR